MADQHVNQATCGCGRKRDHVLGSDWPPLPPQRRWWDGPSQLASALQGTALSGGWLKPFLPADAAAAEFLLPLADASPFDAQLLLEQLREMLANPALAADANEPLLRAIFATAVLADFIESLECELVAATDLAAHVDPHDLASVPVDFTATGFEHVRPLSTDDITLLVTAFGEPRSHRRLDEELWSPIHRAAVGRYCWSELQRVNEAARVLKLVPRTMSDWLGHRARRELRS